MTEGNQEATVAVNPNDGVENLKACLELAESSLRDRDAELSSLREQLAGQETGLASLREQLASSGERLNENSAESTRLLASYKELLLQRHPDIPPELVKGETLQELNTSLGSARELVARVRMGLEAEAGRLRVPAGAPVRSMPDLSALTAREKIQQGIGGR